MILFYIYDWPYYTNRYAGPWSSSCSRSKKYLRNISISPSVYGYKNLILKKTTKSCGSHNNIKFPVLKTVSICRTK